MLPLQIHDLSFTYPSALTPVFSALHAAFQSGWTGVVGPNGCGKTTLLKLVCGLPPVPEREPGNGVSDGTSGSIDGPTDRMYCDQKTERIPAHFFDFLNAWDESSIELMRRLKVEYEWFYRWDTLSFGERKRAQIAAALWKNPDVLALDEPTNHLDSDARRLVADALTTWNGIGIIVSHDRTLLDRLCGSTLFLASGHGTLRPGGITAGMEEEQREYLETIRLRRDAAREERRLHREAQRRSDAESRNAGKLSKRNIAPKDHDASARVDGARLTGKDRRTSDAARAMRARAAAAAKKRRNVEIHRPTFVPSPGPLGMDAHLFRGDTLCRLAAGTARPGGSDTFSLTYPDLVIAPTERIGISGPNGSGKTTLLHLLRDSIPENRSVLFLPQELTATELKDVRGRIDGLDRDSRGRIYAIITQLGSDPQRLLESGTPSPGEARKILVALGVLNQVSAIFMDEPTNYLDLPSVLALEATLKEYPGALVIVSHDEAFLTSVTAVKWTMTARSPRDRMYVLQRE